MPHPLFQEPLPTPFGFRETTPELLHQHPEGVRIVDCREPEEFVGPLGHVAGSELVPMGQLPDAAESWDRSQPLVIVCRSGNRSGHMTLALQQMGFEHVLNLRGGMLAWNEAGLEVER